MSKDPMQDFMRKQRKVEDSAWKNFNKGSRQKPQRQSFSQPHSIRQRITYQEPSTEIHHHTIVHHDIYDSQPDVIYDPPIIVNGGMDWGMLKLVLIIIGGLIFFGVLWLGGQNFVQTHTPLSELNPQNGITTTTAPNWQPPIQSQSPITDSGGTVWNVQIPVVNIESNYLSLAGQGTVNQLPWLRAIAYTNAQSKTTTNIDFMLTNKYTVAFVGLTSGEIPYNSEMTTLGFFNITSGVDISNISLSSCGAQKDYRIPVITLNTWYTLSITQNPTNKTATAKIFNTANNERIFGPIDVDVTNCPAFDRFYIGTRGTSKTLFSNFSAN